MSAPSPHQHRRTTAWKTTYHEPTLPALTPFNPATGLPTTSTTPLPTSHPLHLLNLPPEIRLQIYEAHFTWANLFLDKRIHIGWGQKRPSIRLAKTLKLRLVSRCFALLWVCRRTYVEGEAVMYASALFNFATRDTKQKKVTSRDVPDGVLARIQRVACADVGLARALWERTREMLLLSQSQVGRTKVDHTDRVGVYALKEMVIYVGNDLLFGLSQPKYVTEEWYKDDDPRFGRCLELAKLREFLEDAVKDKHKGGEWKRLTLRLRTAKKAFENREIELKIDGTVVIRGVKSVWHNIARSRAVRWLQLSPETVVVFEDSGEGKMEE